MNARTTILTLAAGTLFAAAPAFADHGRSAPVHGERPVPYGVPHTYPAPVYAAPAPPHVLSTLGGAIIGAAIGSQIGNGNGRTAATAIGAVGGGVIGSGP